MPTTRPHMDPQWVPGCQAPRCVCMSQSWHVPRQRRASPLGTGRGAVCVFVCQRKREERCSGVFIASASGSAPGERVCAGFSTLLLGVGWARRADGCFASPRSLGTTRRRQEAPVWASPPLPPCLAHGCIHASPFTLLLTRITLPCMPTRFKVQKKLHLTPPSAHPNRPFCCHMFPHFQCTLMCCGCIRGAKVHPTFCFWGLEISTLF